jgi:mannosyltransferase
LALFNAAGLWTQYAFAFVMLSQGILALAWLFRTSPLARLHGVYSGRGGVGVRYFFRALGMYVLANLLALALYAFWIPTALHQIATWPKTGTPVSLAEAFGVILSWLAYGITYAYSSPGSLAIAEFVLLFGFLPLYTQPGARWRMLVPAVWVVVSIGAFLALGLFRQANLKLLLPAQIGLALWMARGLWMLWNFAKYEKDLAQRRRDAERKNRLSPSLRTTLFQLAALVGGAWLVFNATVGIGPLHSDPAYQRADYRAIVSAITGELRSGDAIILDAPNQEEVFRYYYQGDAPVFTLPPGLGGDDDETHAAVDDILDQYERAFTVFWGEAERDPNRIVETALDSGAFEVGDVWYGDVRLSRYVMPAQFGDAVESGVQFGDHITLTSYALSGQTFAPGDVVQMRFNWQTDAPLETRYKVFVHLLGESGTLVAQRDSEPGGGLAVTTSWTPGDTIHDNHGLLIPPDLSPAHYLLIVGLYNLDDPQARLPVYEGDYLILAQIAVENPAGA